MRRWEQLPNLHRLVLTHEGHTIACASVADARLLVESVNAIIGALDAATLPRQAVLDLTEEALAKLMNAGKEQSNA